MSKPLLDQLIQQTGQIILGKERQIRLIIATLLARGHVLIEDVPGVGKTTLAHALAKVLGLDFQRIQFTSDLLPADILGVSIYDKDSSAFKFHRGPIFAQMILADEVNRATPKTQSALLEAMEEHQVTVEGRSHALPEPFFVLATQNPMHQIGTFPLPESQLDRFMTRVELGYPDAQAERHLLQGTERRQLIADLQAVLTLEQLLDLQRQVPSVTVSEALLDYVQALLQFSRDSALYSAGLSPRAGLALLRCAQAWAILEDRDFVIPDDIQAVLPGLAGHRLSGTGSVNQNLVDHLLQHVPIP
jgi:MoxR-like ATPase